YQHPRKIDLGKRRELERVARVRHDKDAPGNRIKPSRSVSEEAACCLVRLTRRKRPSVRAVRAKLIKSVAAPEPHRAIRRLAETEHRGQACELGNGYKTIVFQAKHAFATRSDPEDAVRIFEHGAHHPRRRILRIDAVHDAV